MSRRYTSLTLLLVILAQLCCRTMSAEQRFAEVPAQYQEVSQGEDVKLRCVVQDKRGQCIWQKDRKPVGVHPDKYEWAGGRDGDCSLLVKRASLDFDDGLWECQVTPGDFTRQDALTSPPARLLVRGMIYSRLFALVRVYPPSILCMCMCVRVGVCFVRDIALSRGFAPRWACFLAPRCSSRLVSFFSSAIYTRASLSFFLAFYFLLLLLLLLQRLLAKRVSISLF